MSQIRVEHIERPDDPWKELAFAIVRQAVLDYRTLGAKLESSASKIETKHLSDEMKSISRFFLGEWFIMLTGYENGTDILERLDEEVFGNDDCT